MLQARRPTARRRWPSRALRPLAIGAAALIGTGPPSGRVAGEVCFDLCGGPSDAAAFVDARLRQRSPADLELIRQNFTVEADGALRFVYRVSEGLVARSRLDATDQADDQPAAGPGDTVSPGVDQPATAGSPAAPNVPGDAGAPDAPNVPDEPPPPELTIDVVNFGPIDDPADVDGVIGPMTSLAGATDIIDGVRLESVRGRAEVGEDGTARLIVRVPTDGGNPAEPSVGQRLELDRPGFFPIRVEFRIEGEVVARHGTIVQRLPGPFDRENLPEPVDLALVASVEPGEEDRIPAIVALAETVNGPVDSAIWPGVLADVMSSSSIEERERTIVALANDELVALPDVELDVSSAVAAGHGDTFARYLSSGERQLTASLPDTPARRGVWIARDPISDGGARLLSDLGYRFIVMTPELYETTFGTAPVVTDSFIEVPLDGGGSMPVLVVDSLSAEFTSDSTDQALRELTALEWAIEMAVELSIELDGDTQTSRVLAGPDLVAVDGRLVAALESIVEGVPGVRISAASRLPGRTGVASDDVRFPSTAGPDLTGRVERIDAAALALASAGSMLTGEDERPANWTGELSSLISTGIDDREADATITALLEEADRLRGAVIPPDAFTFTLTGRTGEIPIRLRNTSDEPLSVIVRLDSPKLIFPENDRQVTLRANDETELLMPVRARSNGTSPIVVDVRTPLGESVIEPVTLTSRVNSLTGLGQVITAAFVLMLITWWFSHWRARRRPEDATADGDQPVDPDDPDDPGAAGATGATSTASNGEGVRRRQPVVTGDRHE